jgi:hypothetical protein
LLRANSPSASNPLAPNRLDTALLDAIIAS